MMQLKIDSRSKAGSPIKVLCLGAHSDDIEIGCGGTILKLIEDQKSVAVSWVVFSAGGERSAEATRSAELVLRNVAEKKILVNNFRDGFFPYQGGEIKELFESIKREFEPDVIFTHYRDDRHQDHRIISDLTWNTFRDHFILEYEIPKYDGDLGSPNLFVQLDETTCRRKVQHILKAFQTQKQKHWFTEDVFWSMLRLRGLESAASGRFAEAYYSRKSAVTLTT